MLTKKDFHISNSNQSIVVCQKGEVPYLTFSNLNEAGVIHGFSTRLGGVSKQHLSSMNLSFSRGDEEENVRENFRRFGEAIGVKTGQMVFSDQQHHTMVRRVTAEDRGKGIVRKLDYQDVDGLITNDEGVCLVTFYADCIPLFFYDPVKRAIGLSHSGWRGTVNRMGEKTIQKMNQEFGSKPEELIVAIGPGICQSCYEVSRDVYEEFAAHFTAEECVLIFDRGRDDKFKLDLWKANELVLLSAGIRKEKLNITDICTCCNEKLLFSHRASKGLRGNLAGFIML